MSRTIKEITSEYNELCEKHNVGRVVKKFRDKETAIIRLEALKTKLGIEYEPEEVNGVKEVAEEIKTEKVIEKVKPTNEIEKFLPKNRKLGTTVRKLLLADFDENAIVEAAIAHCEKEYKEKEVIASIRWYQRAISNGRFK